MDDKKMLFALGRPFSPLYGLLMRLREKLYRQGVFRSTGFAVPVISVGNLTMGGTGKTPLVRYIAQLLQQGGRRPAIISRGYGGRAKGPVNIVSNGREVLLDGLEAGDEPRLLAESLKGVPVLTGPVRRLPAAEAVRMGADVLILDDGFQHLAVRRDLDLVLFHADTLAGNSRVFPGGDLREPVAALHRCHAFVLTNVSEHNQERAERFAALLTSRFPGKPIFYCAYKAVAPARVAGDGASLERVAAIPAKVFGFCGIGNPGAFQQTLAGLGVEVAGFQPFADHFVYGDRVMAELADAARRSGATALVTTEKDLVKLRRLKPELPLYVVPMEVEADDAFDRFVRAGAGCGLERHDL